MDETTSGSRASGQ